MLQSRCSWWFDPLPVIFMWLKNSCGVWQKRGKAIAYRVTGVSWNTIENIFSLRVSCCTFHFPNVIKHYALKICLHNAQLQCQGCHVLRTPFLRCFSTVALSDSLVWILRYSLLLLLHVVLYWTLNWMANRILRYWTLRRIKFSQTKNVWSSFRWIFLSNQAFHSSILFSSYAQAGCLNQLWHLSLLCLCLHDVFSINILLLKWCSWISPSSMGALLCRPENGEENSDLWQISNTWLGFVLPTCHPRRGNGKCFVIVTSVRNLWFSLIPAVGWACMKNSVWIDHCPSSLSCTCVLKLGPSIDQGCILYVARRHVDILFLTFVWNLGCQGCGVQRGTCTRLCGRPTGD